MQSLDVIFSVLVMVLLINDLVSWDYAIFAAVTGKIVSVKSFSIAKQHNLPTIALDTIKRFVGPLIQLPLGLICFLLWPIVAPILMPIIAFLWLIFGPIWTFFHALL